MNFLSPEAAMEAVVTFGGKVPAATGRVGGGLVRLPMVVRSRNVPLVGSNRKNSPAVVKIKARPSLPKVTPRGELASGKICLVLSSRLITVRALLGGTGVALLP